MAAWRFEHVVRDPLTVVVRAGQALLGDAALAPLALARYPLVVPPEGTLIRQSAESVISAFGLPRQLARVATLSVSLSLELALRNDAVWFVPSSLAAELVARKVLVRLPMPLRGHTSAQSRFGHEWF